MNNSRELLKSIPREVLSMVRNMASFEQKVRDQGVNDLKAYLERPGPIPQDGKFKA